MLDRHLSSARTLLRFTFGAVPVLAGLDKFTKLLTNWVQYLNPLIADILPVRPTTFMHVVGIVEICVGLAILTRFTRWGAYVAAAWLSLIALNLISSGHYLDVAVRDLVMATGAFTLARLEEARSEKRAPHVPVGAAAAHG
jgi:uncharacterized membrane protein YphA (DoxX/SURF4 family)